MSAINGEVKIAIVDGRVQMETGLDPVIVCQALIRVLAKLFEDHILKGNRSSLVLPY